MEAAQSRRVNGKTGQSLLRVSRTDLGHGIVPADIAYELLRTSSEEVIRLKQVRGAHRRTARRIGRALAVFALATTLLSGPFPSTASAGWPEFEERDSSLAGLDLGERAKPSFGDIDGDGDSDLLVGNADGTFVLFINGGTDTAPYFDSAVTVENPLGFADVDSNAAPAFVDIDQDGDLDVMVGNEAGDITLFENAGTRTASDFEAGVTVENPFGLLDVGSNSTPAFVDIDDDGDADLLVGNSDGEAKFFENERVAGTSRFIRNDSVVDELSPGLGSQLAPAFADLDGDGDFDLAVGAADGDTVFFINGGTPATPSFEAAQTVEFGVLSVGGYAAPAFADLDKDGDPDILLGTGDGMATFAESTVACPPQANPFCRTGFSKGRLIVNEIRPGKERAVVKLLDGSFIAPDDLGTPTAASGSGFAVCIYDDAAALATSLRVDRAGESCGTKACWKEIGHNPALGTGFTYKDKSAAFSGIQKLLIKGGSDTKASRLLVKAGNNATKGQSSLPLSIVAALEGTTAVDVQFVSTKGLCYSVTLSDIRSSPGLFKAK